METYTYTTQCLIFKNDWTMYMCTWECTVSAPTCYYYTWICLNSAHEQFFTMSNLQENVTGSYGIYFNRNDISVCVCSSLSLSLPLFLSLCLNICFSLSVSVCVSLALSLPSFSLSVSLPPPSLSLPLFHPLCVRAYVYLRMYKLTHTHTLVCWLFCRTIKYT